MPAKNIAEMKSEVREHIEQDRVIDGIYWNGSQGCFIGCLTKSNDASKVTEKFGIPEQSVRIAEFLFESLSEHNSKLGVEFFKAVPEAIGTDGKDLSKVHWKFLKDVLENISLQPVEVQLLIDSVKKGINLLAEGGEWSMSREIAQDMVFEFQSHRGGNAEIPIEVTFLIACATQKTFPIHLTSKYIVDATHLAAQVDKLSFLSGDTHIYTNQIKRQRDVFLKLLKEAT